MIHRHGFLCATPQIQISVGFQQSLGAGIFGGDGFLLQHVSGTGTAWIELSGELILRICSPAKLCGSIRDTSAHLRRVFRFRSRRCRESRT